MPRWPDNRPISATVRKKKPRPRKYGPPVEPWVASWYWPPNSKVKRRDFPTEELAWGWVAEIQADHALADGPKYKQRLAQDLARRINHDIQLRTELPMIDAERTKRAPPQRQRNPYRTKHDPARLGSIRKRKPRARKDGTIPDQRWIAEYYDENGKRHAKCDFPTEPQARRWHDEGIRKLVDPPLTKEQLVRIQHSLEELAVIRRLIAELPRENEIRTVLAELERLLRPVH